MNRTVSDEKKNRYHSLVGVINGCRLDAMNDAGGVEFEAFDLCREVNLWSYWQGGEDHLNAGILLVGQDWGTLSYPRETIARTLKANAYDRKTFVYMDGNSNPTNHSLCQLFKEIDSAFDLAQDRNTYTDLFFTNLIPWYRRGERISGGDIQRWMRPNFTAVSEIFTELVDIIQPEKILCLGRLVFDTVISIGGAPLIPKEVKYNAVIDDGSVKASFKTAACRVYPLAHCGSYGVMNRNDRAKLPREQRLDRQKQDWQRILID